LYYERAFLYYVRAFFVLCTCFFVLCTCFFVLSFILGNVLSFLSTVCVYLSFHVFNPSTQNKIFPLYNNKPFRSTWVHPRFLVGFVLLDLQFFCVMFCISLFVLLSFFLCYVFYFFDLLILITPLVFQIGVD